MKKFYLTLIVCLTTSVLAQAQKTKGPQHIMPFGKVDMADLQLKECDFEKDANAMILFDKGDIYYDDDFNIIMERHKRIKIFNEHGKDQANIRIPFHSGNRYEYITGIQAETINEVNGKPEITKLDKKQLFLENIDKSRSAYVFSLPNVKPGSIIEYSYRWGTNSYSNFPSWFFQSGSMPTRYSELTTSIPDLLIFTTQSHKIMGFDVDEKSSESKNAGTTASYSLDIRKRALFNIPSLPDEPYMSSDVDNLQSLFFQLTTVRPIGDFVRSMDSWAKVGGALADDDDFGMQFKRKLAGEETIITKAKTLKTDNEKIAYIFKEVQSAMKWNGDNNWYTNDGTVKAWEKKTGNSAEINIILYHLLKQAGVRAMPMLVSTRDHGKVNPFSVLMGQFNSTVVYVPVDSTRSYIMDATNKYNMYNVIPDNFLNSAGVWIDKDNKSYDTKFIILKAPANQVIMVTADIKADGHMAGNARVNANSYNRINSIRRYKTDGEQKYIDYLRNNDNNLKISALKMDNMEVDSLPLEESIDFKFDLTSSDGNYIYFSPTLFAPLRVNPFLKENRMSDIDFGYRNNFSLVGRYKIPPGYTADALPKSIAMQMPDKSIVFRRVVGQEDGQIVVNYNIDYRKTIYFKEDYPELFAFYKKLNEMMNEQIVLKKS